MRELPVKYFQIHLAAQKPLATVFKQRAHFRDAFEHKKQTTSQILKVTFPYYQENVLMVNIDL